MSESLSSGTGSAVRGAARSKRNIERGATNKTWSRGEEPPSGVERDLAGVRGALERPLEAGRGHVPDAHLAAAVAGDDPVAPRPRPDAECLPRGCRAAGPAPTGHRAAAGRRGRADRENPRAARIDVPRPRDRAASSGRAAPGSSRQGRDGARAPAAPRAVLAIRMRRSAAGRHEEAVDSSAVLQGVLEPPFRERPDVDDRGRTGVEPSCHEPPAVRGEAQDSSGRSELAPLVRIGRHEGEPV